MFPAVLPPRGLRARQVDFRLKPGWRYNEAKRIFASSEGLKFVPPPLPRNSRIVYKMPVLAKSRARGLTGEEQELARYMQLLLPSAEAPERYAQKVRAWPCVDYAQLSPEISLPAARLPRRAGPRNAKRAR